MTDFVKKVSLTELENKIPDTSNLATKTALSTVENKTPDVTNLATKTESAVNENKKHDASSLLKKTDYNTRVAEVDNKVSSLDGKIAEKKKMFIENELKKLIKKLAVFLLANIFFDGSDGCQAYLVFQPAHK